jgi:hypothetical protein
MAYNTMAKLLKRHRNCEHPLQTHASKITEQQPSATQSQSRGRTKVQQHNHKADSKVQHYVVVRPTLLVLKSCQYSGGGA